MNNGESRRQAGFTYVAMLIAVALIGLALAAASEVWSQSRQREREQELLFIGHQFRQAIALYYQRSPGVNRYPEKLEDLLKDSRSLTSQRYLRKIFVDPMTGKREWGTVAAPGGGIMGVYSLSREKPIKTSGFAKEDQMFRNAAQYSKWRFVYPTTPTPALPAAAPAKGNALPGHNNALPKKGGLPAPHAPGATGAQRGAAAPAR